MTVLRLGVVADDVTGACDLAGVVTAAGLPASVLFGPPSPSDVPPDGAECVVVALRTRTAPVASAVAESVAAGRWLLSHGAQRLYQKYCSTFDSTAAGNIGPIADALAGLVGGRSVGTPATPAVGRTVYQGHLFVDGRLLSESPLRDHPLTPMTNADLVRLLSAQTPRPVGLVRWPSAGVAGFSAAEHVLLDALTDADLDRHAALLADGPDLLGGASGLAGALARHWAALAPSPPSRPETRRSAPSAAASAGNSRPDKAHPDVARPDIARPDKARTDVARPDDARTDITRPDSAHPDSAHPDDARPDIARPDDARSVNVGSGDSDTPPGRVGGPPYGRAPTHSAATTRPPLVSAPQAGSLRTPGDWPVLPPGGRVVLAGSCSARTREQIAAFDGPVIRIAVGDLAADSAADPAAGTATGTAAHHGPDPATGTAAHHRPDATTDAATGTAADRVAGPARAVTIAVGEALAALPKGPVVVTTSLPPEELRAVQERHGRDRGAALAERALAAVASALADAGVRRFLVAGGETSGAVTEALGIRQVRIGAQVAPGVPWTVSTGPRPVALLLKSGNFGPPDLFTTAWEVGP
ncbi:four-carbon acid sugar kinase family protein [Jiangella alba]|uniref:Putative nucleotide-binding of sugar-metabolising enzyme n=1 Tax=Jiangella alba TaxID=561176 RepID=A0A1H5PLN4_9ACTN|nr:four-carbon acid sugar kinase family protein [Jiangella alba]SEF14614.1 Putative nucleotide-binding of sugar-metabolising enzyme [Jiangella alba]